MPASSKIACMRTSSALVLGYVHKPATVHFARRQRANSHRSEQRARAGRTACSSTASLHRLQCSAREGGMRGQLSLHSPHRHFGVSVVPQAVQARIMPLSCCMSLKDRLRGFCLLVLPGTAPPPAASALSAAAVRACSGERGLVVWGLGGCRRLGERRMCAGSTQSYRPSGERGGGDPKETPLWGTQSCTCKLQQVAGCQVSAC